MKCGACGRLAILTVPCDSARVCLRCFRRLCVAATTMAAGLAWGVV